MIVSILIENILHLIRRITLHLVILLWASTKIATNHFSKFFTWFSLESYVKMKCSLQAPYCFLSRFPNLRMAVERKVKVCFTIFCCIVYWWNKSTVNRLYAQKNKFSRQITSLQDGYIFRKVSFLDKYPRRNMVISPTSRVFTHQIHSYCLLSTYY